MARAIALVQTSDRNLNQIQRNFLDGLQPILQSPLVNGTLLSGIELISGQTNIVNHGLNRKLLGWVLTRVRAQSTVWDDQDLNPDPDKTLLLQCSTNVTVDLYVF